MERWGADLYGNPCLGCGFDWNITGAQAVNLVRSMPERFAARLAGASGQERLPDLSWTSAAYVCHVTDNLRIWAERLVGAQVGGAHDVAGYNPDRLAEARCYDEIALAGALWSLAWAARAWAEALDDALAHGVVLQHAVRGAQRAEDVARNNAHDAYHHLWDVDRIVRGESR